MAGWVRAINRRYNTLKVLKNELAILGLKSAELSCWVAAFLRLDMVARRYMLGKSTGAGESTGEGVEAPGT